MPTFARAASRAILLPALYGLLVLAGCRTVPPPTIVGPGADAPWAEQRAGLETLARYGLDGRVAVAANGQGFSANLRYAQRADGSDRKSTRLNSSHSQISYA